MQEEKDGREVENAQEVVTSRAILTQWGKIGLNKPLND